MPHSHDWSKRLLRELRSKSPASLLERIKTYADSVFLDHYYLPHLDEWIFSDPTRALKWARVAPDLALATPEDEGPTGRQEHRGRLVQAWIILGSAYRATGRLAEAEAPYAEAMKIIDSEAIPACLRADTIRRLSYLRACQGRAEESLELATRAVALAGEIDEGKMRSRTLIAQGYALATLRRFSEALTCFGQALVAAGKPDKRSPADLRLHSSICNNLAQAISDSRYSDQRAALRYIKQARELVKGGRRFLPRYRLLWVEGLVWGHLGYHRRAEKALVIALEGFEALELPFEMALVSLDLGQIHAIHSEWNKLEPLARNAFERFRLLSADTEAITALSLYLDAVRARKLTEEITTKARQVIESRIGPGGCCKTRERGPS